jgi:hypothetical protein
MQQGTITELGQSKSGKPKVKISGTWYSIGTTHGLQPGSTIEFEAHEFQYNGKQFWGIDKFGLVGQPPTASVALPQAVYAPMKPNTAPIGASPPMSSPAGYTEPERMFLSNVVAAAISSGKVTDPLDLPAWMNAALYALRNVKGDLGQAEERDIPF